MVGPLQRCTPPTPKNNGVATHTPQLKNRLSPHGECGSPVRRATVAIPGLHYTGQPYRAYCSAGTRADTQPFPLHVYLSGGQPAAGGTNRIRGRHERISMAPSVAGVLSVSLSDACSVRIASRLCGSCSMGCLVPSAFDQPPRLTRSRSFEQPVIRLVILRIGLQLAGVSTPCVSVPTSCM